MNYLNNFFNWKVISFCLLLILFSLISVLVLMNIEIKRSTSAILEVDSNKNFSLKFSTSNISLLSSQKDLSINLESKIYFLSDVEFVNLGNNTYRINFLNDDLYKDIKTNSLYEVKIYSGFKKMYELIFGI